MPRPGYQEGELIASLKRQNQIFRSALRERAAQQKAQAQALERALGDAHEHPWSLGKLIELACERLVQQKATIAKLRDAIAERDHRGSRE